MAFSQFDRVPNHYGGPIIETIKEFREGTGKRSLEPTQLRIGDLEILVPRHFGFCFGVERAIHMAFTALEEHPNKRVNLLSEIIHNPLVNDDLRQRQVRFIYDREGRRQVAETEISAEDVVLIPAFGTTLEIERSLSRSGIDVGSEEYRDRYDTTCPFVSKVWDRGEELGKAGYTIVIHGKFGHEETQATHSHTRMHTKTLVVLGVEEARKVAGYIEGTVPLADFERIFADKWSDGFDPKKDLQRVAVVNQTTMLAEETREVAGIIRDALLARFGDGDIEHHFADTSDTLCYATNWNQNATKGLLESRPDVAVVVGGYNSSNTSHIVEICSEVMPSYLVSGAQELLSRERIRHFDVAAQSLAETEDWLPELPLTLAVTSGASCPDILMNEVIEKVAGFCGYGAVEIEAGLAKLSLCAPAASAPA
jgi:4-hydroxy-3-methylbut-2-enyl diphosphate reductase